MLSERIEADTSPGREVVATSFSGDRVCRHDARLSIVQAGFDSRYLRQFYCRVILGAVLDPELKWAKFIGEWGSLAVPATFGK
jgi:hypothetical protein